MSGFTATKTTWGFLNDDSFVRVLLGPIGSGKSVTCVHEIIRRATEQAPDAKGRRKTRWGIIRNTVDQLRSTTLKTLFDWFPPGEWGVWRSSDKIFTVRIALPDNTQVHCEIMALALDHPDDVRKALSLELTGLFINEAREVAPEVIDGLLMRLRRYPSAKDGGATWSGAILDSNPPDDGTWFHEKLEEPPENWSVHIQPPAILNFKEYVQNFGDEPDEEDAVMDARGVHWWVNPAADNIDNLDPRYYPDIIPGKTKDFVDVYLRCRYGRSLSGMPVYETTFNAEFHVAKEPFKALKSESHPLIIGLDFGRTPSAVIGQRNVHGQLVLLAELISENMGIETFLSRKLKPRLSEADLIGCHALIAPDPAGWAKQQIGEVSPVDLVKAAGFKVARPATNDPERRVEAVEKLLLDHIDGKPALVINPACETLIKGFRYGYKYKLDKQGVQADRPMKNKFSHCFVGGTLVSTPGGDVPIESLRPGDIVSTPFGPKRVTDTMRRRATSLVDVSVDRTHVRCTGDHPFYTRASVVLADELQYTDVLLTLGEKRWDGRPNINRRFLRGSSSTKSHQGTMSRARATAGFSASGIFTALCGRLRTALSRTGSLCTTSTTTAATTRSTTCNSSQPESTPATTRASGSKKATRLSSKVSKLRSMLHALGTAPRKVWYGIASTASEHGKGANRKPTSALIAASRSSAFAEQTAKVIAALHVRRRRGSQAASTTSTEPVLYAEVISELIATGKLKPAPNPVVEPCSVNEQGSGTWVYDLTVEKVHCFFAGGLLVSNCHDATQYLCLVASGNADGKAVNLNKRRNVTVPRAAGWT